MPGLADAQAQGGAAQGRWLVGAARQAGGGGGQKGGVQPGEVEPEQTLQGLHAAHIGGDQGRTARAVAPLQQPQQPFGQCHQRGFQQGSRVFAPEAGLHQLRQADAGLGQFTMVLGLG